MTTNLSGSLSEFSLAEVLSLLGMGGRTARMQVTCADAVGTVHLVDGRISSATADSARAGLLRGVVAALPVPADDLAQALLAEAPVRSLVDSGVVDREGAQQVASEHYTEAVGEMLDWTSGEFAVWVGSQDPADIGVRLDVHELVAAARERAQEWHDLRAALPESDCVLALVPEVAQAPVVDREDWAVLARIDGRRTLAEVLAAQGASPLAAGNRLVQLLGRGLVAVRVGGGDAEQQRTNQMLDAFDAGGPVDEVVVDEVVEVVASAEPEFVPEVHDLFVTEPEAVEEWQVAVADSWSDSELAPVVSFSAESSAEPAPDPAPVPAEEYAASSEWAGMVAPEFLSGTEPQHSESFTAEVEPVPFDLDPTALELEPTAYEIEPTTFELEPTTYEFEPTAYDLQSTTLEACRAGGLRSRPAVRRRVRGAGGCARHVRPGAPRRPGGGDVRLVPVGTGDGARRGPRGRGCAGVPCGGRLRGHGGERRRAWPHRRVPRSVGTRRGGVAGPRRGGVRRGGVRPAEVRAGR
jgi:hypothetical protein